MGLRDWLGHTHYWGTPHRREEDSRIIQICYECGKEREVRIDLHGKSEPHKEKEPSVRLVR